MNTTNLTLIKTPTTLEGNTMKPQTIADAKRLGYIGSSPVRSAVDSENDDWYTPSEWLDAARYIMDGIELDPFSSEKANDRVRASKIYTLDNSSFDVEWNAKSVWMNPPYSRGLVSKASDKFISEFERGGFKNGMVLVNNMTDTKWYRRLLESCALEVLITGRIAFENGAGQRISGNTRGQTLFLFSKHSKVKSRFVERMTVMGHIVRAPLNRPKAIGI